MYFFFLVLCILDIKLVVHPMSAKLPSKVNVHNFVPSLCNKCTYKYTIKIRQRILWSPTTKQIQFLNKITVIFNKI